LRLGGRETVIAEGGNLRLNPDFEVDWWRFDTLSANPETMSEALAPVKGRPLEGVLEGWAERDYWVDAIEASLIAVALAAADNNLRRSAWEDAVAAADIGLRLCPHGQRVSGRAIWRSVGSVEWSPFGRAH
jgi:hypothetical protein